MNADSGDSHTPQGKSAQAYEVLAACLRRRAAGETLSDAQILDSHADLRPELEVALAKMRLIDGAFDDYSSASLPRTGQLHWNARCPNCDSLSALSGDEIAEQATCAECGTTFDVSRELAVEVDDAPGDSIGHFALESLLGKGAFGAVWRARDTRLDRDIAIKLPLRDRLDQQEVTLFLREASAAASLSHPNIVSVHEVGHVEGRIYIVSDLIEGETLARRLRRSPMHAKASASMCCSIARALQSAHDANVVHRDLKPSNILVDAFNQPYVTDFGMAKRFSTEATMTGSGQILGTPAYMSPEQARGDSHLVDGRSDVYSLGVVFYEMLTGETPFRGTPQALFARIEHDEPPRPRRLNPLVPRDLETICLKCLEKKPERRYLSMDALGDDLQRYLERRPIGARPVGSLGRAMRWCQRKPTLAGTWALLAMAILGGLGGVTWQWRKTETALATVAAQRDRADRNKQQSWELIEEFLLNLGDNDLKDRPGMGELREKLLTRAAHHLERLAAENVGDREAQMELAGARGRLGSLMHAHGNDQRAIELIDQAIEALMELEQEAPNDALMLKIADRLREKGQVASATPALGVDAAPPFEEALRRFELLIAKDRENLKLLRKRADLLAKLGWEYRQQMDEQTVPTLMRAIEACDALPSADRIFAFEWKTKCYTDLAEYELGRERIDTALEYGRLAIATVNEGRELEPDHFGLKIAFCSASHSLGVALTNNGQSEEAIPVFRDAAEMRRQLSEQFPKQAYFREHWASLTGLLGMALVNTGRSDEAIDCFEKVIEIRRSQLAESPQDWTKSVYLAGTFVGLAKIHMDSERYADALTTTEEVLQLTSQQPDSWLRYINEADALALEARALTKLGRTAAAVAAGERAAEVVEMLVRELPPKSRYRSRRVSVLADLIDTLAHAGLQKRAVEVIQEGEPHAREALASQATDSQSYAQVFFTAAGEAYLGFDDPKSAIPMLESAIRDVEVPAEETLENLMECYLRTGREAAAEELRKELEGRTS